MISCVRPVFMKDLNRLTPCGKCVPCLKRRQAEWSMRMDHEAQTYKERGFGSSFITLTYDDEHLPLAREEEHTEESDFGTLKIRDIQLFKKRLRNYAWRYLAKRKIKFSEGREYGPTGTRRPHCHMIVYGMSYFDMVPYRVHPNSKEKYPKMASEVMDAIWSGDASIGRFSEKRSARKNYAKPSISKAFDKFIGKESGRFKGSEIQRKYGSFENFKRQNYLRRHPIDCKTLHHQYAEEAFDRFSFNQVKTKDEGFDSIGFNTCDDATPGSMRYVANYAMKGYFEMNQWPSRIPVRKRSDGKYYDKRGNVISDEERHKPLRDKYGRLKPSVRHSRGLGKDWALAHADELREKLGIPYVFEHKDYDGHVVSREERYAPLPRYYKKTLDLKPEVFESKAKEFMQKDFDEYQKATGKLAIINAATKEDREKQEYILEQFYNVDGRLLERCDGERKRQAEMKIEMFRNDNCQFSLENVISFCDNDLKLPVFSDLFPEHRITVDYFAWCQQQNKAREDSQLFWLREKRTRYARKFAFCA